MSQLKKYKSIILIIFFSGIFIFSLIKGSILVKKSEKELNIKTQKTEAKAEGYSLTEIDAMTGQIRWKLKAKEGLTEDNLQGATIKGITTNVYKDNKIVFTLSAPYAKGSFKTNEIYLLGDVIAKNPKGDFTLNTNKLAIGRNTSIEAQNGFHLILKGSGDVIGENVVVNDDQSKIKVKKLKRAHFKNIELSGENVEIIKDSSGELKNALITNGGEIIIKNKDKNDKLTASTIKWVKDGDLVADTMVNFISDNKSFHSEYLLIKANGDLFARNNVSLSHDGTKCTGTQLVFKDDLVTITGRPTAIQGQTKITADKIIYNLKTKQVQATGNIKTRTS